MSMARCRLARPARRCRAMRGRAGRCCARWVLRWASPVSISPISASCVRASPANCRNPRKGSVRHVPSPRRNAPPLPGGEGLCRLATVPIYRSDAVVRRAKALQAHPLNRKPALRLHENDARAHGLLTGVKANVDGAVLPVVVDPAVPEGCAWIEAGHQETASLPPGGAVLTITKA